LIVRCGEGMFCLKNDKIYVNLTVPLDSVLRIGRSPV
jgi:hypothetical protein